MAPPFTGTFHLPPGGVEHLTLWFSSLSCLSKDGHHQLSFTKRPGEQPWQLVSHCCVCPQRRQSSVHSDQMPWEHLLKMMSPSLDFPTCHCISPIISHFNASDGGSQNSKHIQLYFWVCQLQRVFYQHPHLTGELQRQGLHKLWCNWSWPHQLLQTPFSIVSRAWEGMDASRGPSSSEHTATSIGRPGNTQAPGRIQSLLYEKPSLWILQSPAEKPALTHRLLLFFEGPTLELICSLCTRQTRTLVGISVQMQKGIPHPAFSIHKDSVSSETTSRWD